MDEWQIYFEVKGLVAPEKPLKFDDKIAFKKATKPKDEKHEESDDLSVIFIKSSVGPLQPKVMEETRSLLQKILYFYGLVAGRYVEFPYNLGASQITESAPFGEIIGFSRTFSTVTLNDKQKEEWIRLLKYSMQSLNKFGSVFTDISKRYLKNAIIYYYRALKDLSHLSNEEALIDEMISLESLLGATGYKLSLRASILLSLEGKENAYDIQQKIEKLLKKRNGIVHGSEEVSVTNEEVLELTKYVNKIIFIFLKVNKPKKDWFSDLDKSILEWNFRKKLEQLTQKHF